MLEVIRNTRESIQFLRSQLYTTENKDSEESEWYLFKIIDIFTEKCITGVYKLNIPQIKLWYNLSITVHKLYMNDQPPIQDQMLPTKPDISKTILMGRKDKDLQCSYIVLIMPCQWKKKREQTTDDCGNSNRSTFHKALENKGPTPCRL